MAVEDEAKLIFASLLYGLHAKLLQHNNYRLQNAHFCEAKLQASGPIYHMQCCHQRALTMSDQ